MGLRTLSDDYLESARIAALFDDHACLEHMLAFESALAACQARAGLIPDSAAAVIERCAESEYFDVGELRRLTAASSNPAIPLVSLLTEQVAAIDESAARYVHWGSTSQDVVDSALMLSCRAALAVLHGELRAIEARLAALMNVHRSTPMVARTLGQNAGPTSFGAKLATWAESLLGPHARLLELHDELPLQFAGATGTLAAFGQRGPEIGQALALRLGLRFAPPWHTERSAVRDLAACVAALSAAAGKIATDIVLMAQTEIAELVPGDGAAGGSSALPNKRNPVAAIAAVAGARRTPGTLATIFAAFDMPHERAVGAWHAEVAALGELFVGTGGGLESLRTALDGSEADIGAMRRNLELGGGLSMAEAVSMALAHAIGRPAAQARVKSACARVRSEGIDLGRALAEDSELAAQLSDEARGAALDPMNYLGVSDRLVDAALERIARLGSVELAIDSDS